MKERNERRKLTKVDLTKNYEDLANAIVMQACIDYQSVMGGSSRMAEVRRKSIEEFFNSQLFGLITDIEPNELINRLKKGPKIRYGEERLI